MVRTAATSRKHPTRALLSVNRECSDVLLPGLPPDRPIHNSVGLVPQTRRRGEEMK